MSKLTRPKLTPQIAYNLAKRLHNASGERDERLESVIAQDPYLACLYALDILKGPWPEAEPVIAQNAMWAFYYARDMLKGPFPEAEIIIAPSSWADRYADVVLKTPEDRARFREVQQWVAQD
jgi:hypothetical protein